MTDQNLGWIGAVFGKIFSRGVPLDLLAGLNFTDGLRATPNLLTKLIDVKVDLDASEIAAAVSGAIVAGDPSQVQYNQAGAFAGAACLVIDASGKAIAYDDQGLGFEGALSPVIATGLATAGGGSFALDVPIPLNKTGVVAFTVAVTRNAGSPARDYLIDRVIARNSGGVVTIEKGLQNGDVFGSVDLSVSVSPSGSDVRVTFNNGEAVNCQATISAATAFHANVATPPGGAVVSLSVISTHPSVSDGAYPGISPDSGTGTGTGLNVDIDVSGGVAFVELINSGGVGYQVGEQYTFAIGDPPDGVVVEITGVT